MGSGAQLFSDGYQSFVVEENPANRYKLLKEFYYRVYEVPDSMLHYAGLLSEIAEKENNNAYRAIALQMLSDYYYFSDDINKSQDFLFQSISIHESVMPVDTILLRDAYINVGVNYNEVNRYYDAIVYFDKAITICGINDIQVELADIYSNKGISYFKLGEYQKAIEFLLKASEIDVHNNDSSRIASNYNNIARVYVEFEKYNTGIEYYKKSLDICLRLGLEKKVSHRYNNIGMAYMLAGEYKFAEKSLKKSLEIERKFNRPLKIATRYNNLGEVNYKLKNNKTAIDYLTKAAKIFTEQNDSIKYIKSIVALGLIYLDQGNTSLAFNFLYDGYGISNELKCLPLQKIASEGMYQYYKTTGNSAKALELFEEYTMFKDSIFYNEIQSTIENLEIKYETEKKVEKIALLNKETEQQKIIIAQKNREQIIWFVFIATMLIAIAVILIFFGKVKKQREGLKELNTIKNRLFALISHDLRGYSTVFQDASFVLNHHVKKQNYDKVLEVSKSLQQSAHSVDIQLNNILNWASSQLKNYTITIQDLNPKKEISQIIESLEHAIDIKHNIVKNELSDEWMVMADRGAFVTIFHNLITNANKFTENGRISIIGKENEDYNIIAVEDNGLGMDRETQKSLFHISSNGSKKGTQGEKGSGIGLMLVKHYADLSNIKIDVNSKINEGSMFMLKFSKNNS